MSEPVGTPVALSPSYLDAARARAHEFGFGDDLAGLGENRWQVLCQAVELTVAHEGNLPDGWQADLARQAGRDGGTTRQDLADTRLAEQGEVFAVDDDA